MHWPVSELADLEIISSLICKNCEYNSVTSFCFVISSLNISSYCTLFVANWSECKLSRIILHFRRFWRLSIKDSHFWRRWWQAFNKVWSQKRIIVGQPSPMQKINLKNLRNRSLRARYVFRRISLHASPLGRRIGITEEFQRSNSSIQWHWLFYLLLQFWYCI